jgi:hypothetical protein
MNRIAAVALLAVWGSTSSGCAGDEPSPAIRKSGTTALSSEIAGKARTRPQGQRCPTADRATHEAAAWANDVRVCPSTVGGATTRVEDVAGGVRIVVTATNAKAAREIRDRATRLTPAKLAAGDALAGGPSNCPIHYVPGTQATVQKVSGGIQITVLTSQVGAIEALRGAVKARAVATAKAADLATGAALAVRRAKGP